MLNTMNIDLIAKNLNLTDERMTELLAACGVSPVEGGVSVTEVVTLMNYAKEHSFDREKKSRDYLEMVVGSNTIFIDTCELLHDQFPTFMERATPLLVNSGKQLMVPSGVLSELKTLFFRDDEMRDKVGAVLNLLEQKETEGVVCIVGSEGETFADQQMLTIATAALLSDTLLFITRDNRLSEDIIRLNGLSSVRGGKVVVNRINKHGYLSRYITAAERENSPFFNGGAAPEGKAS